MKLAAESNLKNVTLELGGKSPNIVFDDADLDQAVSWAAFGINFNAGQTCCAGSRLYLQESIKDQFLEKLVAKFKEIQVGDPAKKTTFQGPQVSQTQFDRISAYIQSGKDEGATLLVGGERHGDEGYFIQPTLFSDVKPEMKILKEEIFGPVLVVATFKDEADVIAQANSSEYGLASAVFSKDVRVVFLFPAALWPARLTLPPSPPQITRAISVAHKIHSGTVWVNQVGPLVHVSMRYRMGL